MAEPIFKTGIQGLSDSLWSGTEGSCSKLVGIDYRTKPGTFQAHQKLSKHSSTTIDQLCKNVVNCSDGSRLWFSSESGKIWREVSGTYTLVHTTVPTSGEAKCLGAIEYSEDIFWATEDYLHKIAVADLGDWTLINQNWQKFLYGDNTFHPMTVQQLQLYVGDKTTIAKVEKELVDPIAPNTFTTTFGASVTGLNFVTRILPSTSRFPSEIAKNRSTATSDTSITHNIVVPNKTNRLVIIYLATVRTDGAVTTMPTTISVGSKTATRISGIDLTETLSGSDVLTIEAYQLVSPDVGTLAVTATFASSQPHIVMQSYVVKDALSIFTPIGATSFTATSNSASSLGTPSNFELPICFYYTQTTTHTKATDELTIYNESNTYGRDSSSIINVYPDTDFTNRTEFNLVSPERIQTMTDFDIDILVGTRDVNKGRVLRWDGVSEGWSAQDDLEEQGINAFIRDDNYMYVQAGFYGRMYFYNGEKLDPYKRIPGDWSPTKTAKINPNASAFHLGVPVFGLSNVAGNPTLQGVYGFGSYGVGYPKTLSLDFPIPTNVFEGVEIGSMVADGADLYVSYKDATDVGVAKLDWANKYNGAYLETNALMGTENRSDFTNIDAVNVDYTDLPANTGITIAYKKNYDSTFTTLSGITFPKLKQVKARETITDIANLILKISLTTNTNATPNVENVSIGL
jgi:hypothetical protein